MDSDTTQSACKSSQPAKPTATPLLPNIATGPKKPKAEAGTAPANCQVSDPKVQRWKVTVPHPLKFTPLAHSASLVQCLMFPLVMVLMSVPLAAAASSFSLVPVPAEDPGTQGWTNSTTHYTVQQQPLGGGTTNVSLMVLPKGTRGVIGTTRTDEGESPGRLTPDEVKYAKGNSGPRWPPPAPFLRHYGLHFNTTHDALRIPGVLGSVLDLAALDLETTDRTVTFSLKVTADSRGMLFALSNGHWWNSSAALPLLDAATELLFGKDGTSTAKLFATTEYAIPLLLAVNGDTGTLTFATVDGGGSVVERQNWVMNELFDGQWHHVALTIKPLSGTDLDLQLFVDGGTGFSNPAYRKCFQGGHLFTTPLREPNTYYATSADTSVDRVQSGGTLVLGYGSDVSLFNLQFHDVALTHAAIVHEGSTAMKEAIPVTLVACITTACLLILGGLWVVGDNIKQVRDEILERSGDETNLKQAGKKGANTGKAATEAVATSSASSVSSTGSDTSGMVLLRTVIVLFPTLTDTFQQLSLFTHGWSWPEEFKWVIMSLSLPFTFDLTLPVFQTPPYVTLILVVVIVCVIFAVVVIERFIRRDRQLFRDAFHHFDLTRRATKDMFTTYFENAKVGYALDDVTDGAIGDASQYAMDFRVKEWSAELLTERLENCQSSSHHRCVAEDLAAMIPPAPETPLVAYILQWEQQRSQPKQGAGMSAGQIVDVEKLAVGLSHAAPGDNISGLWKVHNLQNLDDVASLVRHLLAKGLKSQGKRNNETAEPVEVNQMTKEFSKVLGVMCNVGASSVPHPANEGSVPPPDFVVTLRPVPYDLHTCGLEPEGIDLGSDPPLNPSKLTLEPEAIPSAADPASQRIVDEGFTVDDATDLRYAANLLRQGVEESWCPAALSLEGGRYVIEHGELVRLKRGPELKPPPLPTGSDPRSRLIRFFNRYHKARKPFVDEMLKPFKEERKKNDSENSDDAENDSDDAEVLKVEGVEKLFKELVEEYGPEPEAPPASEEKPPKWEEPPRYSLPKDVAEGREWVPVVLGRVVEQTENLPQRLSTKVEVNMGTRRAFEIQMKPRDNLCMCPQHKRTLIPASDLHMGVKNNRGASPYMCNLRFASCFRAQKNLDVCTVGDMYVCSDDACAYTLCVGCAHSIYGEKRTKAMAMAAQQVYDAKKDPAAVITLLALLVVQAVYMPAMQQAIMVVACHPTYFCLFSSCYDTNKPVSVPFVVSSVFAWLIILVLGVGLPGFFLFELNSRRLRLNQHLSKSECVERQWKWFLTLDRSVLSNLYRKYEFRYMLLDPVFLVTAKTVLIVFVMASEVSSLQQHVSVAVLQVVNAVFLIWTNPLSDPWADLMIKAGASHQLLQLGWNSVHQGLTLDDPQSSAMGPVMISTLCCFLVVFCGIMWKAAIQPYLRSNKIAKARRLLARETSASEKVQEGDWLAAMNTIKLVYSKDLFF